MARDTLACQPEQAHKTWRIMSIAQAKELSRVLCGNEDRAAEIQPMADEFAAQAIIVEYMNKPMMSDEAVRKLVEERLELEA